MEPLRVEIDGPDSVTGELLREELAEAGMMTEVRLTEDGPPTDGLVTWSIVFLDIGEDDEDGRLAVANALEAHRPDPSYRQRRDVPEDSDTTARRGRIKKGLRPNSSLGDVRDALAAMAEEFGITS